METILKRISMSDVIVKVNTLFIVLLLHATAWGNEPRLDYNLSDYETYNSLSSHSRSAIPSPDFCYCLANDGNHLWVGTTAGVVRWNLKDNTTQLFKIEGDWTAEYASKMVGDRYKYDQNKTKSYLSKWVQNAVENIVVLSPGHVYVDTFNGAMVIQGNQTQVFASKEKALASLYHTESKSALGKVLPMDREGRLWRLHQIGSFSSPSRSSLEIRCYDGKSWKTVDPPRKQRPNDPKKIRDRLVDKDGNKWGCTYGGSICRWYDGRWKKVLQADGPFEEFEIDNDGKVRAIGPRRLAQFDGEKWKMVYDHGYLGRKLRIEQILVDTGGSLWACGEGGIYHLDNKGWKRAMKGGHYRDIRLGRGGVLWAFAMGKLAKFDGKRWKVFQAKEQERYKDFMLLSPYSCPRRRVHVAETADGKLWFAAYELGMMCFDGTSFQSFPDIFYSGALAIGPDGRLWGSTGQRIWYYQQGKWTQLIMPKSHIFKVVRRGGEVKIIYGLETTADGTLYVATTDGLFKYKNNKWEKMIFDEGIRETEQLAPTTQEMMIQDLEKGRISASMLEASYKAYVEGEGRKLIKATNNELFADILNSKNSAPMISYYRLFERDEIRAKQALHNRIRDVCKEPRGEWTTMELATLGRPAVEFLLQIAKSGTDQERRLAVETLAIFQDKTIVDRLLKMLNDSKEKDAAVRLWVARAAVMVGNSRGIDILIEGATGAKSKLAKAQRQEPLQSYFREELQRAVRQFTDLPDSWSRNQWDNWWEKHRPVWTLPQQQGKSVSMMGLGIQHSQRIYREIARKLESTR